MLWHLNEIGELASLSRSILGPIRSVWFIQNLDWSNKAVAVPGDRFDKSGIIR